MPDDSYDKSQIPKLDQLVRSAARIKFPAGAFGKTCMLVAIFALACALIAWAARNPYVSSLALIIVAAVAFYALKRAFDFADKNPSAAILEGAEFVKHEQIQLAAKGVPVLPPADVIQTNEPENIPVIENSPGFDSPETESSDDTEATQ